MIIIFNKYQAIVKVMRVNTLEKNSNARLESINISNRFAIQPTYHRLFTRVL